MLEAGRILAIVGWLTVCAIAAWQLLNRGRPAPPPFPKPAERSAIVAAVRAEREECAVLADIGRAPGIAEAIRYRHILDDDESTGDPPGIIQQAFTAGYITGLHSPDRRGGDSTEC